VKLNMRILKEEIGKRRPDLGCYESLSLVGTLVFEPVERDPESEDPTPQVLVELRETTRADTQQVIVKTNHGYCHHSQWFPVRAGKANFDGIVAKLGEFSEKVRAAVKTRKDHLAEKKAKAAREAELCLKLEELVGLPPRSLFNGPLQVAPELRLEVQDGVLEVHYRTSIDPVERAAGFLGLLRAALMQSRDLDAQALEELARTSELGLLVGTEDEQRRQGAGPGANHAAAAVNGLFDASAMAELDKIVENKTA